MAGATQPASPSLRVTLAGGLAISVADDPRPAALPAGKAVTLLALLLARRGRLVPTDTILEALWGESPPAKAEQNVASLVSRLRRIVGRNRIVGTGRGYLWPGDPDCRVDLDEAARLLEVAEADLAAGDASLASVAAGRALDLVGRGEVLADQPQAAWVDDARRDGPGCCGGPESAPGARPWRSASLSEAWTWRRPPWPTTPLMSRPSGR